MTSSDPQFPPAVSKTAPDAQHPPTFTFRPAGEPADVTVALHGLGGCPLCGHYVHAGSFVARLDGPESRRWAHVSCAQRQPARAPLDADQPRDRP